MMKSTNEFIAAADKVRRAGGHFFTFDGVEYRIHDEPDGSIRVESSYTVEQWAREVAAAEAVRLEVLARGVRRLPAPARDVGPVLIRHLPAAPLEGSCAGPSLCAPALALSHRI